jgi:universal stress protein A
MTRLRKTARRVRNRFVGFFGRAVLFVLVSYAMNIKSILFPTDFSSYNDAALKLASTLAAEAKATLYIIHVHDLQSLSAATAEFSYLDAPTWREQLGNAEEQLARILPSAAGVKYERKCLTGNPLVEILKFAESHGVDLIVMASHGRTGLSRLLMGSLAEGVMRKARCPVLIVKQPIKEHESAETPECKLPDGLGKSICREQIPEMTEQE